MNINYFNLPFGAQLLLWTSRVMLNGSCRTFPNKYQLVNTAFNKVGITDGDAILKDFLVILKEKKTFNLQNVNVQTLNNTEVNIINCIEDYKKEDFNSNYYLEIWDLRGIKSDFISAAKKLASAFKNSNLETDLNTIFLNRDVSYKEEFISKTLH